MRLFDSSNAGIIQWVDNTYSFVRDAKADPGFERESCIKKAFEDDYEEEGFFEDLSIVCLSILTFIGYYNMFLEYHPRIYCCIDGEGIDAW
jgi:hypothetical protein